MTLSKEDLALRRTGITASDVVILAGEGRYGKTAHDVYASKVFDNYAFGPMTEAQRLGHKLEPIIVAEVAERDSLAIEYPRPTIKSAKHPIAIATLDGCILDGLLPGTYLGESYEQLNIESKRVGALEIKVVGNQMLKDWADEKVPDYVQLQVQWQLLVSDMRKAIVAALMGTEIKTFPITYDEEIGGALLEIAERFWMDHVLKRAAPEIDGSDGAERYIKARWPRHERPMLQADNEIEQLAQEIFALKGRRDAAEADVALAQQRMMDIVKDAEGIQGDGWRLIYRLGNESYVAAHMRKASRKFDLRRVGKK